MRLFKARPLPTQRTPGSFMAFYYRGVDVEPFARLEGHVGYSSCVAYHPDGTRFASGGDDGTVRIWDTETHEELLVLRGHDQYVADVEFSPDGSALTSASGDHTVRLWDTKQLDERRTAGAASGVIHSCAAFWSARTRPLLRCASSETCSEVASSLRLAANAYAPTKTPHKSDSHH
ncbi:MAG: hypothetical protein GY711_10010 [bacterium]|nr:hypothetical protein [bacterium]